MLAVMHVCCLLLFTFACCAVPCILAAVPSVHKVQALPGLPALAEAQFTGYLPTGAEDASPQLFYWLMQSRRSPEKDALVLWLQGGPGCSGGLGLFWELGPYRVHEDKQTLYKNADAWNSIANVLMIDQPAGTGFSSVADNSSIPVTLAASTKQLHFAINAFLDAFPEFKGRGMPAPPPLRHPSHSMHAWLAVHSALQPPRPPFYTFPSDFWITGESYAGKYIPYLAVDMKQQGTTLSLRGIAVGDGWSSPLIQTSV